MLLLFLLPRKHFSRKSSVHAQQLFAAIFFVSLKAKPLKRSDTNTEGISMAGSVPRLINVLVPLGELESRGVEAQKSGTMLLEGLASRQREIFMTISSLATCFPA